MSPEEIRQARECEQCDLNGTIECEKCNEYPKLSALDAACLFVAFILTAPLIVLLWVAGIIDWIIGGRK